MYFELKLAWKYFTSGRKDLIRFTSAIAVIGIAAGVASLIIAQAISQGFRDEIQDKVLSSTAHINVIEKASARISNWQIVKKKIAAIDGVTRVEPTIFESVVVSSESKSSHGILRVKNWKKKNLTGGDERFIPVSIGKELAIKLSLAVGDKTEIVTFENNEAPKGSNILISEVFETGLYEYDSTWIYIAEDDYRKLKDIKIFSPSVYSISVKDIYQTDRISGLLKDVLGEGYKVIDWQEANKPLFSALSLEKKVTIAIISLIIFIAALNITTTLALLVNERRYDIGVLKTFGANTRSIVSMFLFEGIILGVLGITLGVALGLAACFVGNYLRLINLSKEVYSLNYVPFNVSATGVFQIAMIAFFLCLLAIIYPAIKAGKIKPIENLKTQ